MTEAGRSIRARLADKVPDPSFSYLGFGVLQAWLATLQSMMHATPGVTFGFAPVNQMGSGALAFGSTTLAVDLGSASAFLFFAIFARRLAPLTNRRCPLATGFALMLMANAIVMANFLAPEANRTLSLVGLALAGLGSAVPILYWWEILAVLNPIKVALYYAGSWIMREVVVIALAGYNDTYLAIATLLLPVVALAMFTTGRRHNIERALEPHIAHGATSFPWKPLLLVAFYAFAYGCGTWLLFYQDDSFMHIGIALPALVVCASILGSGRRFNFALVYRIILPVAIAGLLALLLVQPTTIGIVTVFVRASYTSVLIYVSVLLCNLSRRYSISAVWLFSLFNIVHIGFLGIGTLVFNALPSPAILGICIVCIVFVTFIIVSEPSLDSSWRIVLISKDGDLGEQARLQMTVDSLSRRFGLSTRQGEILLLLAQGNSPRSIGHALAISPGTVKAHVQHIYKKLGIHSKKELDALVGQ